MIRVFVTIGIAILFSCATKSEFNSLNAASDKKKSTNTSASEKVTTTVVGGTKGDFQDDKILDRIETAFNRQIGSQNVGVIVAIYNKGKFDYLSLGETVLNSGTPPKPDTIFEIGSITKTFTGLMISRSIDLNRVKPETTLDQIKDEWIGQKAGQISLLELVTHRSGLPRLPCDLNPKDPKNPYLDYTEFDLIQGLTDSKMSSIPRCVLEEHPTSEMNYSNWGFATLGYTLVSQQNKTYETLLKELVLNPLNLTDTTITLSESQKSRLATGYDEHLTSTPLWDRKILFGNGAIRSSAKDLMKYAIAYLHPDQTPIASSLHRVGEVSYDNSTRRMGYAWNITQAGSLWHNGMTGGFSSFIKIYPKRDLAVLYLSNTAHALQCFIESIENVNCEKNSN